MLHSDVLQEIPAGRIEGLRIGNAQDEEAKTGVTVLLFDQGARVGIDVSGGGPASRPGGRRRRHALSGRTGSRF